MLTQNALTALPPALCGLSALKLLQLDGNRLTSLPAELGALSKLEKLSVAGNCLTSLPDALGRLTSLKTLCVARNALKELPAALAGCVALEELDAAGEWWVDAAARELFYCANGTAPPPAAGWVAGQLGNLVTLAGTAAEPVEGVAIEGLTFEFSEPTFLRPFTVASGGDWSFHDGGALRLWPPANARGACAPLPVDVAPRGGRAVIFMAGAVDHAVLKTAGASDRVAATAWVQ